MIARFRGALLAAALCGSWLFPQGGPRNIQVGGVREFAYRSRVYTWSEKAGAFLLRRELPPLFSAQDSESVRDIAWDGEWAYRVVVRDGKGEIQHGMVQATQQGPQWFWRPGPQLAAQAEMVIAAGRRAVFREERPAPEGQPREMGSVRLTMVDLVEERTTVLDEQPGIPGQLTVTGCVLDGQMFCFWGTGKVLRIGTVDTSPKVESENFWNDLDLELAPFYSVFLGATRFVPPRQSKKPFFTRDGRLAMRILFERKMPEKLIERLMIEAYQAMDEPDKKRMRDQGAYPVTEKSLQKATAEASMFFEWDFQSRKMREMEISRWQHLMCPPPMPPMRTPVYLPKGMGLEVLKGDHEGFQVDAENRVQDILQTMAEEELPRRPTLQQPASRKDQPKPAKSAK